MKARLVHVNGNYHLLLCTGDIKVLKPSEAIDFLLNFDRADYYAGTGTWDAEDLPMEDYRGDTVAIVNDETQLQIESSSQMRSLFLQQDIKYLTVPEFAKLHNKQNAVVRRLCQNGRIEGAVLKGKTWIIPETSSYPKDERFRNPK